MTRKQNPPLYAEFCSILKKKSWSLLRDLPVMKAAISSAHAESPAISICAETKALKLFTAKD